MKILNSPNSVALSIESHWADINLEQMETDKYCPHVAKAFRRVSKAQQNVVSLMSPSVVDFFLMCGSERPPASPRGVEWERVILMEYREGNPRYCAMWVRRELLNYPGAIESMSVWANDSGANCPVRIFEDFFQNTADFHTYKKVHGHFPGDDRDETN